MVAKAAHAAGLAPKVHYAAPGVMVSEFITGKTYEASDVRRNADAIAALVARFHNEMAIHVSGSASMFWVFHVVRDYVRTLGAYKSQWSVQLAGYLALNAELEAAQAALPIVFAHNDLLPANFIDDGAKLWLIDFEYAGFSTAMFDVASVAAHGQMSDDEAQGFLQRYFGGRNDSVSLRGSFLAMQCAAILREALWAMVSDHYLKTPGVDFKAYAQENLARLEAALEQYRKATS
jgi:thiamine kinase-like enzyme